MKIKKSSKVVSLKKYFLKISIKVIYEMVDQSNLIIDEDLYIKKNLSKSGG